MTEDWEECEDLIKKSGYCGIKIISGKDDTGHAKCFYRRAIAQEAPENTKLACPKGYFTTEIDLHD